MRIIAHSCGTQCSQAESLVSAVEILLTWRSAGPLGFPSRVVLGIIRGPEDTSDYRQLDLDGRRQAQRQSTGRQKPCPRLYNGVLA